MFSSRLYNRFRYGGETYRNPLLFFVGGKKYNRWGQEGFNFNDIKEKGGKYLVKYVCDNPEESRMYFDKPIEGDSVPFKYLNWVE